MALAAADPDLRVLRRAIAPPVAVVPKGALLLSCCAIDGGGHGCGDRLRTLSIRPFRADVHGMIAQIGTARRWTASGVLREPLTADCEVVCDAEAGSLLADAELIVAHDAKAVRPLVEGAFVVARGRPWMCTKDDIDWTALDLETGSLSNALRQTGHFLGSDDPDSRGEGLLRLLAHRVTPLGKTLLGRLLESACRPSWLVDVEDLQPAGERMVATAGYALIPGTRRWWREVGAYDLHDEVDWLTWQVCGGAGRPRVREIGWRTRHTLH